MNDLDAMRGFLAWILRMGACCACLAAGDGLRAGDVEGITAVASRVSKGYIRSRLPDGSFGPETYAFGKGGNWRGEIKDATIDNMRFLDVAHVIAYPLASQKYIPARDPRKTDLLIMVYWGTTAVPPPYENDTMYQNFRQAIEEYRILLKSGAVDEASSVYYAGLIQLNIENGIRDRLDFKNATLLGYNSESSSLVATDYGAHLGQSGLGVEQRDQVAEIEENRYFVVLMAYDFQLLWKKKKHRLLWETRFSINERRNAFDKALPVMAQYASKYFGQDSHGILREPVPEGRVDIGEVKSVGTVP